MATPIDFGKLWEWIEDPITVILRKRTGIADDAFTSYVVPYVLKRATDEDTVTLPDSDLEQSVTRFHFWKEVLDCVEENLRPDELDQIVVDATITSEQPVEWEGGTTFTVFKRNVHNRGKRFRCFAYQNIQDDGL